ncbi:hypothetical protein Hanom_Chr13g01215311 [Helianthus anomalus]
MADALEVACNDLLPAYADLMDKVTEDGMDSLRLMLDPAKEPLNPSINYVILFPNLIIEEMGRQCRNRKISDVLQNLDAADGLVGLQDLVTEEMVRDKRTDSGDPLPQIKRSCKSIGEEGLSKAGLGVARLSADTLMQAFPSDHVQRCRMVYERRRSGRRCASLVDDRRVSTSPVGEVNVDDLIVDPHPLEYYGEALYTPAEVRAMFADV